MLELKILLPSGEGEGVAARSTEALHYGLRINVSIQEGDEPADAQRLLELREGLDGQHVDNAVTLSTC